MFWVYWIQGFLLCFVCGRVAVGTGTWYWKIVVSNNMALWTVMWTIRWGPCGLMFTSGAGLIWYLAEAACVFCFCYLEDVTDIEMMTHSHSWPSQVLEIVQGLRGWPLPPASYKLHSGEKVAQCVLKTGITTVLLGLYFRFRVYLESCSLCLFRSGLFHSG